jgi:hypothetical protein
MRMKWSGLESLRGRDQLRTPEHRWEYNINMYLTEIGLEGVDWILSDSGYGPVVGSCEYGSEPSVSLKGREFLD